MFAHWIGPGTALVRLMETELATEAARLDLKPGDGVVLRATSPGVLSLSLPGTGEREVSFFVALGLLHGAPNLGGALAVTSALTPTRHRASAALMPYPRNSASHVQVGDIVGTEHVSYAGVGRSPAAYALPLRAARILVGEERRPVVAVPRAPSTVSVTVETEGRRGAGSMALAEVCPPAHPAAAGRESLAHLRRVSAQARRLLDRETEALRRGYGDVARLFRLQELATCAARLVEVEASHGHAHATDEARGEAAFLRMSARDLDRLRERLARSPEWLARREDTLRRVGEERARVALQLSILRAKARGATVANAGPTP